MMTLKDMIIAGVEATKLVGPKSSESDRYQLAFDRINKVRDRCLKSKENPRVSHEKSHTKQVDKLDFFLALYSCT